MTQNRGSSYCESRIWGGAGAGMIRFARNWPLAAQLGPGTVRNRFGITVGSSGLDSQVLATILGPVRTIFADLGPDRQMPAVETGQMSSVETGQMSAVETGQMSAVETRQMSSAETRQMSTSKTGRCPVSLFHICLVSAEDVCVVSTADICPASTADTCPVSTADISSVA